MAKDDKPQPSLRPTTPATLCVAAIASGALMLMLVSRYYSHFPEATWYTPAALAVLAVVVAYLAFTTKARLDRRPGTEPPDGLMVARYAALAKASSLGGAIFTGVYAGFLMYVLSQRSQLVAAEEDVPGATFGVVSCVLLVAAAMWLENACRIPPDKDDDEEHNHEEAR